MNSDIFLTLYTKVNLKWIKELNLRAKTINKKLLEENRGVNLTTLDWAKISWAQHQKHKPKKKRENDSVKTHKPCNSKETVKTIKRQFFFVFLSH